MSLSYWRHPDKAKWREEYGFSDELDKVLDAAFAHISNGRGVPTTHVDAANMVHPFIKRRMSAHQRMHAYLALTTGNCAAERYMVASYWLDRTARLAFHLRELDPLVELLLVRADINRQSSNVVFASEDTQMSLDLLNQTADPHAPLVARQRLQALSQQAIYQAYAGRYEDLERAFEDSYAAMARIPSADLAHVQKSIANLNWAHAVYYRLAREPLKALSYALEAGLVYQRPAISNTAVRMQCLIVEIIFDWIEERAADTSATDADNAVFMKLAAQHLRAAEKAARTLKDHDTPGQWVTTLARSRYQRLKHSAGDRTSALYDVLNAAREMGDEVVVGQALMELGAESQLKGDKSAAYAAYRGAFAAFGESQAKALQNVAKRKLEPLSVGSVVQGTDDD
ncbi:MAG TPA: hypothetical protein VMV29_09310 [Ktedonobacterales bacterium]|nr:hypothetical protein [Ktedonobacterales bacterium]